MASPQLEEFQQRQEREEGPLIAEVLAWIAALRTAIALEDVAAAITSGATARIFDLLARARKLALNLAPIADAEGQHAIDSIIDRRKLELRFNIYDPGFRIAVEQHGAYAIREIDQETRAAIQRIISDAYRNGWHPRVFAPMIRDTIGLTTRQSVAVSNLFKTQIAAGLAPSRAQAAAERYALRLRKQRAMTIARTETITAARISRVAGFEQAARNGLFDRSRAYLEWDAVQQDPKEICFQLDGTRVPLGSTFDGLLPPAHPNCRCTVNLVIE